MQRIACGVLLVLAISGVSGCGDDDGDNDAAASPERAGITAEDLDAFCNAVVDYAEVTVPAGGGAAGPAYDALQTLLMSVQAVGAEGLDDESLAALRGCVDELTNVLQAAPAGT